MGLPLSLLPRELLSRHVLPRLPPADARGVSRAFRAGFDAGCSSLKVDSMRGDAAPPADLLVQLLLGRPALEEI